MSDERERRAGRDGDGAREQRERCRRGAHTLPDGLVHWRAQAGAPGAVLFRTCRACGAEVVEGVSMPNPLREDGRWAP